MRQVSHSRDMGHIYGLLLLHNYELAFGRGLNGIKPLDSHLISLNKIVKLTNFGMINYNVNDGRHTKECS